MLQQRDQFRRLGALVGDVAAGDRALDAMAEMVLEHQCLDLGQGSAGSADLGQHVDAVTSVLDHFRNAAHLAFDAAEAGNKLGIMGGHGATLYTMQGYVAIYLAGV